MRRLDADAVSPADLGLLLARLMETDPNHPLVLAARLAIEIGDRRAGTPVYTDDYIGGRYHRQHVLPEYTELQKRRYPPTGSRELWIRYGPAGPPSDELQNRRAA